MCGIVGYIGNREAYPILIKGLQRLEYRGYDSAGLALLHDGILNVYKAKGKVSDLILTADSKDKQGNIGIAHTRWATHGEPNVINAHPHYSQTENLALVHNGIIENYAALKEELKRAGYSFKSDTDTEVLVQLIEFMKTKHQVNLTQAVQLSLNQVIGSYSVAVIERNNPDEIVAARKGSPLVVGIGQDEFYLASDATPIVEYTDKVVYIDDEEVVTLNRNKEISIRTILDIKKTPEIKRVEVSLSQLEKEGYPHFMLKEIFEQPKALIDSMRGRIHLDSGQILLSEFLNHKKYFLNAKRIIITACGTSWHAGLIAKYALEEFARIPVEVEYSSEFRYRNPVIDKDDVVIAISQSGETADTLAAVALAKKHGAFVFSICNVIGASIPRATHSGCYTHVGPEIGVASTKAFTAQVMVLTMLALSLAKEKGLLEQTDYMEFIDELNQIPDKISIILEQEPAIAELAKTFTYAQNFIYLGRGYNYPVALEGALKLKEISYIHAEGYPAAEMKHGPIALISQEMPVVVIATNGSTYEKIVNNIQEIKARKGKIISVVTQGDTEVKALSDYSISIPASNELLAPLLTVVPLQLLSYHIAVAKGCDVDQPRNLAKSVTVE